MARLIGRRAVVLGAAATLASSRAEAEGSGRAPPWSPVSKSVRTLQWDLGTEPWGQARAAVVVPTWGGQDDRFPILVALHGRGEAQKLPADGALGWPRDYAMVRAFERLRAAPLTAADYEGFADPARMAAANASLAARPFGGLIVACPWLPDVHPAATGDITAYARFIQDILLPRVRRETPALIRPEATGIDGVSLGGVLALRIGLTSPVAFGSVGGIQAAMSDGQEAEWTALAESARAQRPDMKLRLLTSHEDYFREPIHHVSDAWDAAGIVHDFADIPGPHDYSFNRGPGSVELLLWHDRVLARV